MELTTTSIVPALGWLIRTDNAIVATSPVAPRPAQNSYQRLRAQRRLAPRTGHPPPSPVGRSANAQPVSSAGAVVAPLPETTQTSVPPSVHVAPAAVVPAGRRLRMTGYSFRDEVILIQKKANELCGDYRTFGSDDGAWRDVDWGHFKVRKGECARLFHGARRSRRIAELSTKKQVK